MRAAACMCTAVCHVGLHGASHGPCGSALTGDISSAKCAVLPWVLTMHACYIPTIVPESSPLSQGRAAHLLFGACLYAPVGWTQTRAEELQTSENITCSYNHMLEGLITLKTCLVWPTPGLWVLSILAKVQMLAMQAPRKGPGLAGNKFESF